MIFESDHGLLLETNIQLVVLYTIIEVQVIFKILLALVASQLAIVGQLGERSTCRELGCFLKVRDNTLEGINLADEATGNVFALFWEVIALSTEEA